MTRLIRAVVSAFLAFVIGVGSAGPARGQEESPSGPARDELNITANQKNEAVAVNTTDGASVFRVAFSIVQVANGTVDQENLALAYASCNDCKTVALAFQVVIVVGDANYIAPVNQSGAINEKCAECLTFASATQIVVGVTGPVTLTPEGWRRMVLLARRMALLESNLDQLTAAQLATEVSAIETELISILSTELVPVGSAPPGQGEGRPVGSSTTTTTSNGQSSTTTTPVTTSAPTTIASPTTTGAPTTTSAPEPATTVPSG